MELFSLFENAVKKFAKLSRIGKNGVAAGIAFIKPGFVELETIAVR